MANGVFVNGRSVEIERKFLIKMPDVTVLEKQPNYNCSYIEQIYIATAGGFHGDRIRKREFPDRCKYYRTHKEDINGISRFEDEREISAEEYELLAKHKVEGSRAIKKFRHCFEYKGQLIELDIYDFWSDKATLEIELESEYQAIELPDFIEVIADVTTDKAYRNYSLSFNNNI